MQILLEIMPPRLCIMLNEYVVRNVKPVLSIGIRSRLQKKM